MAIKTAAAVAKRVLNEDDDSRRGDVKNRRFTEDASFVRGTVSCYKPEAVTYAAAALGRRRNAIVIIIVSVS